MTLGSLEALAPPYHQRLPAMFRIVVPVTERHHPSSVLTEVPPSTPSDSRSLRRRRGCSPKTPAFPVIGLQYVLCRFVISKCSAIKDNQAQNLENSA